MPERKSAGSGTGTGRGGKPVGRPSSRGGKRPAGPAGRTTGTKPEAGTKPDAKSDAGTSTTGTTTRSTSAAEPSTAKSSTAKSSTAKSSTAKSSTAKTSTAKTSTAKTSTAKSSTAKSSTAEPTTAKSGTGKSSAAKVDGTKSGSTRTGATKASPANSSKPPKGRPAGSSGRPPNRAPQGKGRKPAKGRSIVNQKQRPWGLIITTAVVVIFAAAVVIAVVATRKGSSDVAATTRGGQAVSSDDPYRQPEAAAAAKIKGVTYRVEAQHTHVEGSIKYDRTPPVGGEHSQYWADCTGTVYPNAIANENAVHMLEHGAIWITYNKSKLSSAQVTALAKNVSGVDRMAMSPYPNLKTPISLQAWGYQLFVSSPTDPRIAQFIAALKYNKSTTPEYGATCSQPTFKSDPSTFGHPLWTPKNGASGNVMGA